MFSTSMERSTPSISDCNPSKSTGFVGVRRRDVEGVELGRLVEKADWLPLSAVLCPGILSAGDEKDAGWMRESAIRF